ncbi:MAG TPA: hypothetical protein VE130_04150 [Nitrososphaeraceae archaeon]|jgi:RNA-binding protein|nr:hypothetical protein [Nitrososphaeraceae archaeon]
MSSIVEAGDVIHVAKSGRLILKIRKGVLLRSGENLFDNVGKKIGKVTELLGPVDAPYASVLLDKAEIKRATGSKMFRISFRGDVSRGPSRKKKSYRNKRHRYI